MKLSDFSFSSCYALYLGKNATRDCFDNRLKYRRGDFIFHFFVVGGSYYIYKLIVTGITFFKKLVIDSEDLIWLSFIKMIHCIRRKQFKKNLLMQSWTDKRKEENNNDNSNNNIDHIHRSS